MLLRIVSMLTRLIGRADVVSESSEEYNAAGEHEYRFTEYRCAEYEYESCAQRGLRNRWTMIEVAPSNARGYDDA